MLLIFVINGVSIDDKRQTKLHQIIYFIILSLVYLTVIVSFILLEEDFIKSESNDHSTRWMVSSYRQTLLSI